MFFYDTFTTYIASLAKKTNRKPAIVIDDHTGGSGTNRPALFRFLEEKQKNLTKIPLASEDDTTFNGYNIVNDTYLV